MAGRRGVSTAMAPALDPHYTGEFALAGFFRRFFSQIRVEYLSRITINTKGLEWQKSLFF